MEDTDNLIMMMIAFAIFMITEWIASIKYREEKRNATKKTKQE